MPDYEFWDYVIFDLERHLSYKQYEIEKLDVDDVFMKWVILKNQIHIEREEDIAIQYSLNAFREKGKNYELKDVPFKRKKMETKTPKKHVYSDAELSKFDNFFKSL